MDSSLRSLHKNIGEWLAGPSGSVLLHVALILALLLLVDFSRKPDVPTVEITYFDPVEFNPDDFPLEPPPLDLDPAEQDAPVFTPDMSDMPAPEPPPVEVFSSADSAVPTTEDLGFPPVPSSLVMSALTANGLKDRLGEKGRSEAGMKYGGNQWKAADAAVSRALEWLRIHQNADGAWGQEDCEAMAGLGILTFLAHGETTASEKYGRTVERAIRYLLARQNEKGEFARTDTTGGTYSQAICVYAVSEAYGMTRIPSLRAPMEKGVQVILNGQQEKGGFDYRFARSARRDTSLGGWCCQAMKAAYIAGANNPGLKESMDLSVADLKSAQRADGYFLYTDAASHATASITAAGVLSLQLLGHSRSAEVRKGLAALREIRCDWQRPPAWPMYAWYYISQAKFHQGGGDWQRWNREFVPQFVRNQNPDGSWNSAGLSMPTGTTGRENYHPVYSTTLAALTLQVYHRFLPTYQPIQEKPAEPAAKDDIRIEVL